MLFKYTVCREGLEENQGIYTQGRGVSLLSDFPKDLMNSYNYRAVFLKIGL